MSRGEMNMHWKKAFNPDYLGAYSLDDGQDMILTIKTVGVETVTGEAGKKEDCLVAHFAESVKPMILNKTNCKTISKIYKTPDTDKWPGKTIQVFQDMTKLKGELVECLRIRPYIPKTESITYCKCEKCGNNIEPMHGMTSEQLAKYTKQKYGISVCGNCAVLLVQEKKQQNIESENDINENNKN